MEIKETLDSRCGLHYQTCILLGAVFVSEKTANAVLLRQRRHNSGHLEEVLYKDNLERECKEELCTLEEAREVFEDNEKTVGCTHTHTHIYNDSEASPQRPCFCFRWSSGLATLVRQVKDMFWQWTVLTLSPEPLPVCFILVCRWKPVWATSLSKWRCLWRRN